MDERPVMPAFLRETREEVVLDGTLGRLSELVAAFQSTENDVERLTEELRAAKEALTQLGGTEIPQLLLQNGLSRIKLANGAEVSIKEGVSVTVPEDKRQQFYQFLANRREGDIVKLSVMFGRMETKDSDKLNVFLNENAYDYSAEEKVHPATLTKYFKELLGLGLEEGERVEGISKGRYLRAEDVAGFARVYTYYTTKIK